MKEQNFFNVAEIKLTYSNRTNINKRPKITSSQDAYDIFLSNWSESIEHIEEMNLLLLNRSNRVLGIVHISKGGVAGTVVDAKVIFSVALKANASSLILAHNHPSGNLKPSRSDLELTKKLNAAGKLMDISVLDHLIITPYAYYSMADEGAIL